MENEQHNLEIEETKRKITSMFNLILAKENVPNISRFKRYFYYLILSIVIFVKMLILLVKNIILLQFTSIPPLFSSVKMTDGVIKDYLEI
jgi:hypothetical protein